VSLHKDTQVSEITPREYRFEYLTERYEELVEETSRLYTLLETHSEFDSDFSPYPSSMSESREIEVDYAPEIQTMDIGFSDGEVEARLDDAVNRTRKLLMDTGNAISKLENNSEDGKFTLDEYREDKITRYREGYVAIESEVEETLRSSDLNPWTEESRHDRAEFDSNRKKEEVPEELIVTEPDPMEQDPSIKP
jgi:hypothetical protein